MSDGKPTTYAELADVISNLPLIAREHRRHRRLSLRAAATECGIGFNSLFRLEKGENVSLDNAVAILRWLDGGSR